MQNMSKCQNLIFNTSFSSNVKSKFSNKVLLSFFHSYKKSVYTKISKFFYKV